jgi:hypothetical protein
VLSGRGRGVAGLVVELLDDVVEGRHVVLAVEPESDEHDRRVAVARDEVPVLGVRHDVGRPGFGAKLSRQLGDVPPRLGRPDVPVGGADDDDLRDRALERGPVVWKAFEGELVGALGVRLPRDLGLALVREHRGDGENRREDDGDPGRDEAPRVPGACAGELLGHRSALLSWRFGLPSKLPGEAQLRIGPRARVAPPTLGGISAGSRRA